MAQSRRARGESSPAPGNRARAISDRRHEAARVLALDLAAHGCACGEDCPKAWASARRAMLQRAGDSLLNAALDRQAARSSVDIRGTNTESRLCLCNAWLDPLHWRQRPIS
jgi:hypothetical protein